MKCDLVNRVLSSFYCKRRTLCDLSIIHLVNKENLSARDVLIEVYHSNVNYKDALATKSDSGVIRHYTLKYFFRSQYKMTIEPYKETTTTYCNGLFIWFLADKFFENILFSFFFFRF